MSLRALLYRRPSEPSAIQVVFDRSIYLVRAAPAPAGAPLHPAHRCRLARGRAHHAAARQREGSERVRAEARRLDRGAAQAAAGGGAVCARHRGAAARRGPSHRASPRRARHGVDRDRRARQPAALRRRRGAARRPPHRRLPQARGAARRSRPRAAVTPRSSASRSSASRCATSRAAGARARIPACCRSPGGSSWRRPTCSTISPRTRSRICVELNHSPRFWRLVGRLYPDVERAKAWLDVNGTDLHRYGLPTRRAGRHLSA